ncbi:L-idonate 5-dehydrogenase [Albirhodobacter sp. R86504]|uniref:L-idonate 5-dehydrogenase n=1 Tax=Albirhodobacter sp. R86504 TaxID=3093848 RepID=UPI0036721270
MKSEDQMKIVRLHQQNDLRIEQMEAPQTVSAGEVLIGVEAVGFCGSDLHYHSQGGIGTIRVREPIILGHEASGRVLALGDGVTTGADGTPLQVGDLVALNPSHPCHECRFCKAGTPHHCTAMRFKGSAMFLPHEQGFMRSRLSIEAAQCYKIAEGVPATVAALAEPLAVCRRAVTRAMEIAGPITGKRVLVTGAGPIGVLCAALARHFGALEVVVTDLQDAPLAVAGALGATKVVNVARDADRMAEYSAEKGQFDLVFECSAAEPALRMAISATRPMGTIVQVGVMGDTPLPFNMVVAKEINLIGTHRFDKEFGQAVALINASALGGAEGLAPMITHVMRVDQADEAIAIASDRTQAVKVQINF